MERVKAVGHIRNAVLGITAGGLLAACGGDSEQVASPISSPDHTQPPATARPTERPLNSLTVTSSPAAVRTSTPAPLTVNRAISLDGRMDGLSFEDAEGLRFTGPFTIEAAVKLPRRGGIVDSALNFGGDTIVSKGDAYAFFAANLGCILKRTEGLAAMLNGNVICSGIKPPEGVFTHLAMTYDGKRVTFYINGSEVASFAQSGGININTEKLFVGRRDGLAPEPLGGEIDWLAMWNRARSASDIAGDARNPAIRQSGSAGLAFISPFDRNFNDYGSGRYPATPLGRPELVEVK